MNWEEEIYITKPDNEDDDKDDDDDDYGDDDRLHLDVIVLVLNLFYLPLIWGHNWTEESHSRM